MFRKVYETLRASRRTRFSGNVGISVLKFAAALHYVLENVGGPRYVAGPSMLPTMTANSELILEDSLTVKLWPHSLARGDLVVLLSPYDPVRPICKRVLGLPGDVVCVDPTGEMAPSTEHVLVPPGHIWIVGDNAPYSRDSRYYGPVPMALVRGRVRARILPWKTRTIFRNPTVILGEV